MTILPKLPVLMTFAITTFAFGLPFVALGKVKAIPLFQGAGLFALIQTSSAAMYYLMSNYSFSRYNLAYINHNLHAGDNGRVVGYDNAHDGHHRHYFGVVEPIDFVSFQHVESRFEKDWIALRAKK